MFKKLGVSLFFLLHVFYTGAFAATANNSQLIAAEAYKITSYLRLFDQTSQMLVASGVFPPKSTEEGLKKVVDDAFKNGVDNGIIDEVLARHRSAFEQYARSVLGGSKNREYQIMLDRYSTIIKDQKDPLPLLLELNKRWASKLSLNWPQNDRFSGFEDRLDSAITNPQVKSVLSRADEKALYKQGESARRWIFSLSQTPASKVRVVERFDSNNPEDDGRPVTILNLGDAYGNSSNDSDLGPPSIGLDPGPSTPQ